MNDASLVQPAPNYHQSIIREILGNLLNRKIRAKHTRCIWPRNPLWCLQLWRFDYFPWWNPIFEVNIIIPTRHPSALKYVEKSSILRSFSSQFPTCPYPVKNYYNYNAYSANGVECITMSIKKDIDFKMHKIKLDSKHGVSSAMPSL